MGRFICMSVLALAVMAVAGAAWAGDTGPPTIESIAPSDLAPPYPCLPGDDCSPPPPPPPAPPPPPPAPPPAPPPPTFPACGDGWDNDGDGLIDYLSDPGCSSETDPDEYDPPPDLNAPLGPSGFETSTAWEGPIGFLGTRCKTQVFTQSYSQAGLYDVIRYAGRFRVCYVPGGRVASWSDVAGDAEWVRPFSSWEWRGNESGYPVGVRVSETAVEFRYRGKAAICLFNFGCGPERHPWVTLTFFSNNTIARKSGVV